MQDQKTTNNKDSLSNKTVESPFDRFDTTNDPKPKEPEVNEDSPLEKVADELHVNLPEVNLPLGLKLVALLTLVGGLGTLSSMFAGIFDTQDFDLKSYIFRLIGGVIFIAISYGIIKRQNWATWLYGVMVIFSLIINWPLAILPAVIVIYMYFNRKYLYPSIFDNFFNFLSNKIGKQLK